jgi:hypothetical protein
LTSVRAGASSWWLWLLVAVQVAIPASYYLLRADREDERFAWRMFSALRLQRCQVQAYDLDERGGAHSVALSRALHASWIGSLERGRERVVERFLTTRCERAGVVAALLERRCVEAGDPARLRDIAPVGSSSGQQVHYRYECSRAVLTVKR